MPVKHLDSIKGTCINTDTIKGATKQIAISPQDGWEGWVMRVFTLAPGGYTPRHTHPWPHINYVIDGEGTLYAEGKEHRMVKGSVGYVDGMGEHQFRNTGEVPFSFICIVPEKGDLAYKEQ